MLGERQREGGGKKRKEREREKEIAKSFWLFTHGSTLTPGLSRWKFGASGLSRGQITLCVGLINNKLGEGIVKKIKPFSIFM